MNAARFVTLIAMCCIIFFMVVFPGIDDPKQVARAKVNFVNHPNDDTRKALAVAKESEKHRIIAMEAVPALAVICLAFLFSKQVTKSN